VIKDALYFGRWHEDAARLLAKHRHMPVSGAHDWVRIDEWADDVATTFEPGALAGRRS